jgi:hypothetical protein
MWMGEAGRGPATSVRRRRQVYSSPCTFLFFSEDPCAFVKMTG